MGSFFLISHHSWHVPLHELLLPNGIGQGNRTLPFKQPRMPYRLIVHYDSAKPLNLVLACDASPLGLGMVPNGTERPVAYSYTSRTLSAAERNYSQLEKEGLAVVFGVKKFHNTCMGNSLPLNCLCRIYLVRLCWPHQDPEVGANIECVYQYNIRYKPLRMVWPSEQY